MRLLCLEWRASGLTTVFMRTCHEPQTRKQPLFDLSCFSWRTQRALSHASSSICQFFPCSPARSTERTGGLLLRLVGDGTCGSCGSPQAHCRPHMRSSSPPVCIEPPLRGGLSDMPQARPAIQHPRLDVWGLHHALAKHARSAPATVFGRISLSFRHCVEAVCPRLAARSQPNSWSLLFPCPTTYSPPAPTITSLPPLPTHHHGGLCPRGGDAVGDPHDCCVRVGVSCVWHLGARAGGRRPRRPCRPDNDF